TLEYPPAALPVFAAPSVFEGYDYRSVFQYLMLLCDMGLVVGVAAVAGFWPGVAAALAPLALGSLVISRFDFWPAALAVWALAFLLRRRPYISAVFLGTAFAAKLWPAALAPLIVVWLARTADTRAAARWLAAAVATAAAWFLPFVVLSPGGVGHSFHAQLSRPLQIESLGGAILIAVHHATGSSLSVVNGFGSQNLSGTGVHAVELATTIAGLAALLAVWLLFIAGAPTRERLLASCAAVVTALVAFDKVFSPQFMIWLIPFVLIVRGLRGAVAGTLLYVALILTQTWFPAHYWDLALNFAPTQSGEVLARNLFVVALFVVLAWPALQHEMLGEHRSRLEALQRVRTQVE
ncbi:MAG TPA: glycosyltransferase 87 family protein, partial [Gaiellaceae bacterium]|nr:glycosyltransferase 87 family protein [Gaiellaceae bacterium]